MFESKSKERVRGWRYRFSSYWLIGVAETTRCPLKSTCLFSLRMCPTKTHIFQLSLWSHVVICPLSHQCNMNRRDVWNSHVVGLKSSPYPWTSSFLLASLRSLNLTESQLQTADNDDADGSGMQSKKAKEAGLRSDSVEQGWTTCNLALRRERDKPHYLDHSSFHCSLVSTLKNRNGNPIGVY